MLHIYWDIDGTLVQAPHSRADLFFEAVSRMSGTPAKPAASRSGHTDRMLAHMYLAASGEPDSRVDEFLDELNDLSVALYEIEPRKLVPGALDAVRQADELGCHSSLLTGNTPVRARVKLSTSGFDPSLFDWDIAAFGGFETNRNLLGVWARKCVGDSPLVIIGDTWRDYLAAKAADAIFVGITTKPQVRAQFEDAGAELVLADFTELAWLEWLKSAGA